MRTVVDQIVYKVVAPTVLIGCTLVDVVYQGSSPCVLIGCSGGWTGASKSTISTLALRYDAISAASCSKTQTIVVPGNKYHQYSCHNRTICCYPAGEEYGVSGGDVRIYPHEGHEAIQTYVVRSDVDHVSIIARSAYVVIRCGSFCVRSFTIQRSINSVIEIHGSGARTGSQKLSLRTIENSGCTLRVFDYSVRDCGVLSWSGFVKVHLDGCLLNNIGTLSLGAESITFASTSITECRVDVTGCANMLINDCCSSRSCFEVSDTIKATLACSLFWECPVVMLLRCTKSVVCESCVFYENTTLFGGVGDTLVLRNCVIQCTGSVSTDKHFVKILSEGCRVSHTIGVVRGNNERVPRIWGVRRVRSTVQGGRDAELFKAVELLYEENVQSSLSGREFRINRRYAKQPDDSNVLYTSTRAEDYVALKVTRYRVRSLLKGYAVAEFDHPATMERYRDGTSIEWYHASSGLVFRNQKGVFISDHGRVVSDRVDVVVGTAVYALDASNGARRDGGAPDPALHKLVFPVSAFGPIIFVGRGWHHSTRSPYCVWSNRTLTEHIASPKQATSFRIATRTHVVLPRTHSSGMVIVVRFGDTHVAFDTVSLRVTNVQRQAVDDASVVDGLDSKQYLHTTRGGRVHHSQRISRPNLEYKSFGIQSAVPGETTNGEKRNHRDSGVSQIARGNIARGNIARGLESIKRLSERWC